MTLTLVDHSRCSLCNDALADSDETVSTTAFIDDPEHPLYAFSDTAMHRACFLAWPERPRFVVAYNDFMAKHYRGVDFMYPDGRTEQRPPRQPREPEP